MKSLCLWLFFTFAVALSLPAAAQSPASGKIRIVLVGDSTVAPRSGWGNAFGQMLEPGAECFNQALGGRSSKSFREEGAWARALALQPDWILIQFGHNDQPGKGPKRETDPNTTYAANLARYIDEARAIGAKPVIVTSLTRRNFEHGQLVSTLGPYAAAARRVATEKQVPLVDLYARSTEQALKLGPGGLAPMEPPGKTPGSLDHTHLNERGGEMIAPLVVEELRKAAPELAACFPPKKS